MKILVSTIVLIVVLVVTYVLTVEREEEQSQTVEIKTSTTRKSDTVASTYHFSKEEDEAILATQAEEQRLQSKRIAKGKAEREARLRAFAESNYMVKGGQLVRVNSVTEDPTQTKHFELVSLAYDKAKSYKQIPDGIKVFLKETETEYQIYFDKQPLKGVGVRGPTYSAEIYIDKTSGAVIRAY